MNTLVWILICAICFCVGCIFAFIVFTIIDATTTNQFIKSLTKEEKEASENEKTNNNI